MGKTVLVTGGAGYIGSHACKALARAGYEPVAYDNLSAGHRWAVRWGPLVEGDLADRGRLAETLARHRPAAIMHFAASCSVAESMTEPQRYFHNNFINSLTLFEAARDAGVLPIVFSSTCATYGPPETLPIVETAPQRPSNPYGESKLMAERALDWLDRAHGMRNAMLRYFNAAGADPEGAIGEAHDPETHLIPVVLEAAAGRRAAVEICGTDYPTPDGTAVRDYVHVDDIALAHLMALDHLLGGGPSLVLNLGTGTGHSVAEIVAAAERVTGRPIPRRLVARRPGDEPILVADNRRAFERLGWRPRVTGIDDIIASAWNWHRKQAGAAREKGRTR